MSIINKEIAKSDFDEKVKFHGLEVFTPQQVANYGASIGSLLIKSEKGEELTEEENSKIKIGKAELNSLNHTTVVDVKEGRIIKSILYVREPQVKFEDTLEKSENGENIQKGTFLDTPLNKELGRVGETFIKGCAKRDVHKSDEYKTYQEFVKKGITNVYDEMKKAHPEMEDNLYNEIKKASEEKEVSPDEGGEIADTDNMKEEGEDEDEMQKSVNSATDKINENFKKGIIGDESCEVAMKQLDDLIQKARPTKYYKREGSPGNYKYYYTKEQHDKAKGKGAEDKKPEAKKEDEEKTGSFKVGDVVDTKEIKFTSGDKKGQVMYPAIKGAKIESISGSMPDGTNVYRIIYTDNGVKKQGQINEKQISKPDTTPEPKKEEEKVGDFKIGDKVEVKSDSDMPTSLQGLKGEIVGSEQGTLTVPLFAIVKTDKGEKKSVNPNYIQKQPDTTPEPKKEEFDGKKEGGEKKEKTGNFKVGDVVYNKKHNTVGIVRLGEERGDVQTDADGNVPVTDLVKYDPEKHKDAHIAPSTQKEISGKDTTPEAKKQD